MHIITARKHLLIFATNKSFLNRLTLSCPQLHIK